MKRIAFLSAIIFSVLYTNLSIAKSNICPAPIVTNFSPTQGPENTLVTINGSNFNDAASVFFDGISTSFSIINDNVIEAYVPAGISSSSIITITSSGGCTGNAATNFTFLDSQCSTADAYISEIYDALSGSYAVIELYNPTSSPIVLDGVYVIERYGDIGNTTPSHTYNVLGTIQPLDTFIIILGSGSDCPSLTADFTVSTGINDNDEFKLLKNGVLIDIVNAPGERGYSIIRNPDAAVSQTTFNGSDWTINSEEDCSDLDSHTADPIPDNTPTVTQPNSQEICENGSTTFSVSINTGVYTYQWLTLDASGNWVNVTNNANYSGANTSTLTVNNAPTSFDGNQYYCEMTSATCDLVSIAVQLNVNNPQVDTLADYSDCSSYTLPALTNGNYFTQANGNGLQLNAGEVISSTQTIYIFNEVGTAPNTCSSESSFTVTISGNPPVDTLADYSDCSSYTLPALTNGNYFTQANGNGLQLNAGEVISSSQTIYIFNEVGTAPNTCSSESSFTVTISGNPPVDTLADYSDCSSYTLPTLTNGNYFTQANGNGTQLNAGDVISSTQTIYIFNEVGTAPNTCSNESSFTVTISGNPPVDTLADYTDCSSYTLPALTNGNYFTQANGNGTQLNAGDVISSTQTIYIFNEVGTAPNTCSNESSFTVTISGNPPVDTLADYTDCSSYTLPALTNGNYFTQANGNGLQLNAGEVISSSQTIYIFNEVGTAPNTCSSESSFTVTISGNPPVDTLADYSDCSSYTLPALTNGNYFTQTNGNGTQLNAGDVISSTQTIYIFNEVGTAPNTCSSESSFTVTISGNPPVDTLADYSDCSSYTLPALTNGNYFTQANGNGLQLNAGEVISSTQTIYIFNEVGTAPNTCSSESSFTVTIYTSVDFSLNDSNISINDNNLIVNMSNTSISYEYAVDNSNFQTSASFYNLSPGTHTLYVQDSNGCIIKSLNFEIKESNDIRIPLFFTPNFDGQNDVWQITDNKNTIKEIYIFDRYGKLLKQVSPRLKRWDGNYNGYPMETNDYWYLITLKTGEQLNGHFTLKR
ncbi:T9SS type B sorting domain-containing protein [Corallibacter sp.]|uniref:T9SS type B sorting domain-containing protein n=1 Tax=Corallibacter sp. TaxID=2038084 RepID=UPI003A9310B1